MSEASNPFRDEATANASQKLSAASDPFRAPAVRSAPSEPAVLDDGSPPPRVSPMWAFLIGQTPFHAGFWSLLIVGVFFRFEAFIEIEVFFSTFVLASSLETAVYTARTLWIGPGRWIVRVPAAALSALAAALLPGWILMLTDFRSIDSQSPLEIATYHLLTACGAALIAGIFFACGSRDVGRSAIRLPVGGADLAATLFVGALLLFTLVPFVVGAVDLSETQLRYAYYEIKSELTRESFRPFIAGAVFVLASMTWRLGIRGLRRFLSWKTLLFALACLPWTLIFGVAVANILMGERPGPAQPLAGIAGLFLVPIAREFFLRFAGYRAINVYAERRRRRREAVAGASGNA